MAKRGPKSYRPGCDRLMPLNLIAQRLGVSVRTVYNDLTRAAAKLRGNPEAYSLILANIHAVEDDTRLAVPACGSVECDRKFIALYGEAR